MEKRIHRILALCIALLCLFAGGVAFAEPQADIFSFLGEEYRAFADRFERDTPVAVGYRADTMSGGCESYLWDASVVRYMFDALSAISVGDMDPTIATDSDYHYFFLMEDGSEVCFSFNQHYLEKDGSRYAVTGDDALWRMTFPCYGGNWSLFNVCMDERVYAFLENLDANMPVSVGFQRGDAPVSTVTDPAFVRQVIDAMAGTEAVWVENETIFDPGSAAKSTFTFTMKDGGRFVFTLYDDCIAVEPTTDALGTQYYFLDSLESLWALSFPGYEDVRVEKGITLNLLPLYGEAVQTAFGMENREKLAALTVTRVKDGKTIEELAFSEEPFNAVSDMAYDFTELGYLEERSEAPTGVELCTFTFTDADGRTYPFLFADDCAVIEKEDGALGYYPVEHSSIDENGVMDLAYSQRDLLAWKEEVNFQGKGTPRTDPGAIIRGVLLLLAAASVLGGLVTCAVLLIKRGKAK